ncbi:MAG: dTDP-4-dehydrorhamnose 3,5-epimerase [Leptolyngbya sp. SIO1D8]|nr:dTDP-4-dehydrorhamnose 3,5-epimerase [Leptolyngbya sp. SIO1D8]
MVVNVNSTKIPGCYELIPRVFQDKRGSFVKTFHRDVFESEKLNVEFAEEYYSISYQNVLRGLHFQLPPMDHIKMVYCVLGEVMDVVVDLRVGSPTYGQYAQFNLSAEKANVIYIPKGMAHGFCVTSQTAIMMYKVSTVYDRELDTGIRWDSAGVTWPADQPIVSERDQGFVSLSDFESPFVYT